MHLLQAGLSRGALSAVQVVVPLSMRSDEGGNQGEGVLKFCHISGPVIGEVEVSLCGQVSAAGFALSCTLLCGAPP